MFTRSLWSRSRYVVNDLESALFPLTVAPPTQVLTGEVPFGDKSDWVVVQAVCRGDRPSRPAHRSCTDSLWALIQRCWHQDPPLRPEILEVSQIFSSVSTN